MALEWLGAISNDEGYFASIDPEAQSSSILHSVSGTIQPTGVESGVEGLSRAGLLYAEATGGENIAGTFVATAKPWMFYLWAQTVTFQNPPSLTSLTRFVHTTDGPVGATRSMGSVDTGVIAVGAELQQDSSTAYRFTLQRWSGTAWSNVTSETTLRSVGAVYFLLLAVNASTGQTALYVNGAEALNVTFSTPIIAKSTPAFYNSPISGKGGGYQNVIAHEVLVAAGDALIDSPPYSSTASGYHVLSYYPNADSTGAWKKVTPCAGPKAHTVRDPEFSPTVAGDRIEATGNGTNLDQLFQIDDAVDASGQIATVEAVYVAVCKKDGTETLPSALLLQDGATLDASPGVSGFGWRYKFYQTPPAGGAWDKATFNALLAGVRNDTATTLQRCYGLVVGAVGQNLRRPAMVVGCPSVVIQRQVAQHMLVR